MNTDKIEYISVTSLIERYIKPFKKEFWSWYKTIERFLPPDIWKEEKKSILKTGKINSELLSLYEIDPREFHKVQLEILNEWDQKNKLSCERGKKIHLDFENTLKTSPNNVNLSKFGIEGTFKFQNTSDFFDGVYSEYTIRQVITSNIGLIGKPDLFIKQGSEIIICDFKTNNKIDKKGFFDSINKSEIKMKYPLTKLDDCNYNHYSLQLSTYAWLIQHINPDLSIKDLILYHIDHDDNVQIYHVPYLKHEVELMLFHFQKECIKQNQRKKFIPIKY